MNNSIEQLIYMAKKSNVEAYPIVDNIILNQNIR